MGQESVGLKSSFLLIVFMIITAQSSAQNLEPIVVNNSNLTAEGQSPIVIKKNHSDVSLNSFTKADQRTVQQTVSDMLNGNDSSSEQEANRPSKTAN
jgi:hypothetical protein